MNLSSTMIFLANQPTVLSFSSPYKSQLKNLYLQIRCSTNQKRRCIMTKLLTEYKQMMSIDEFLYLLSSSRVRSTYLIKRSLSKIQFVQRVNIGGVFSENNHDAFNEVSC